VSAARRLLIPFNLALYLQKPFELMLGLQVFFNRLAVSTNQCRVSFFNLFKAMQVKRVSVSIEPVARHCL
jgi:hypothetical protein